LVARRSLITGGAGFIGSHLAEHLLRLGEEVVVLDNLSTGRSDNIRHLVGHPRFRYLVGNVEDRALLDEAAEGCDSIYHLAAAVGVELILRDPVHTIQTNINATEVVLSHAVRYGKRVLVASTSEVYGKGVKLPFAEDDDVVYGPTSRPRWAYAISKAVDEFLVKAYAHSKGLPGVVTRLFNTVGPRQVGHYGMVIPRFVQQALRGGPITVYGDGSQSRVFGHVLDIVPALHSLLWRDAPRGEVVNLGGTESITIGELAVRVRDLAGTNAEIVKVSYEDAYEPGFEDMAARMPDLTRAHSLIGFAPKRKLDDILRDVFSEMRGTWKPEEVAGR
jgi:UDP-glucose 4-epimerase